MLADSAPRFKNLKRSFVEGVFVGFEFLLGCGRVL